MCQILVAMTVKDAYGLIIIKTSGGFLKIRNGIHILLLYNMHLMNLGSYWLLMKYFGLEVQFCSGTGIYTYNSRSER